MKPELTVKTPEGITFSFQLAGPMSRFLAWGIDIACIGAASTILSTFANFLNVISLDFASAFFIFSYFVISLGYPIFTEWKWRGQTIGKRLCRLRVLDEQGLKLQFSQIVIRNLLRFVDMLPFLYMVGGAACLYSSRCQRLGDFAANTIVVKIPKIEEPDLAQLALTKFNSFREYPHLAARLRQMTTPEEASIVLQALFRRDELDPAARVSLFEELAAYFKARSSFPPETTDFLTEEQFLKNITEILFRKQKG